LSFEGTEAGLETQAAHLRSLCQAANISDAPMSVWSARQCFWSFPDSAETVIAKISILPADLARTIEVIHRSADSSQLTRQSLMYATGLGWLLLEGSADNFHGALTSLRSELEKMGGSLAVLYRPSNMPEFEAWGSTGNSLLLMKAMKSRLDPSHTLKQCRFLRVLYIFRGSP